MRIASFFLFPAVLFIYLLFSPLLSHAQQGFKLVEPDTSYAIQLLKKAEDYRMAAKNDLAIEPYLNASEIFQPAQLWENLVKCYNGAGICYARSGNVEKGRSYLERAKQISNEYLDESNVEAIANVYYFSQHYRGVDSLDLALEYLRKANKMWKNAEGDNIEDIAISQAQIGMIYYIKYDFDSALENFFKAVDVAKKNKKGGIQLISNILNMIGLIYSEYGNYEKAISTYREGLGCLEENSKIFKFSAGILHSNISKAYFNLGDTENALYHNKLSNSLILIHFDSSNISLGSSYMSRGNACFKMQDMGQAKEMLEKAITFFKLSIDDREAQRKILQTRHNLGLVLENTGKPKEAIKQYKEVLKEKIVFFGNGSRGLASTHTQIGSSYRSLGLYDSAYIYLNQAHSIKLKYYGEHHIETAKAIYELAYLAFEEKDFERSLYFSEKSIKNHLSILNGQVSFTEKQIKANPYLDVEILSSLTIRGLAHEFTYDECSNLKKNLDEALNAYKFGLDIIDLKIKIISGKESATSIFEYAKPIFEGGTRVALKLFELTNDPFYENMAFMISEQSKAAFLLTSISNTLAKEIAIPKKIRDMEKSLLNKISFYGNKLMQVERDTANTGVEKMVFLQHKLFSLRQEHDSLVAELEHQHPKYFQLKYENKVADYSDIKNELKHNETLTEYFLGDTTLYTFTITKSNFNVHQQKIDTTFFNRLNNLVAFSKKPSIEKDIKKDFKQFIADSRYLYKILIPKEIRNKKTVTQKLIIVPDGDLNFLPFNLLLTKQPDTKAVADTDYRFLPYLINDHDIRYEYSATLMVESKRSKRGSFWDKLKKSQPAYCGFAPAYSDGEPIASRGEMDSIKLADLYPDLLRGELAPLMYNRSEVDSAHAVIGGRPFLGQAATEEAFRINAPEADILHLAMHGLTNDKEPLFSQLAFERDETDTSDDGRLHAYELYNMRLKADLAVLSACNTGAGKLQRGEGVMSLSRAFKYAGVPNVVMSLWAASDKPTKEIVSRFFKNLKSGMGKDEALCEAQRDYLKNEAGQLETHPYYWSTLMLIGDSEPLFNSGSAWPYFLIGALLVLLVIFFVKRKSK